MAIQRSQYLPMEPVYGDLPYSTGQQPKPSGPTPPLAPIEHGGNAWYEGPKEPGYMYAMAQPDDNFDPGWGNEDQNPPGSPTPGTHNEGPTNPDPNADYFNPWTAIPRTPPGYDPVDPGQYSPGVNIPQPGSIWNQTGVQNDPMDFNTIPGYPGQVPVYEYYMGEQQQDPVTQNAGQATALQQGGNVDMQGISPYTRTVDQEELVQEQLHGLLSSDSKFMQDARRQGLEQANAVGGLGGSVGVGAAMQAALRSALPIATEDAKAFRAAAAQNLDALNQFNNLNLQRATQLELKGLDNASQMRITQMGVTAQMAQAMLQSATQRDLAMLSSETQLRVQEMTGQIQARLADTQFRYSALLNDQQAAAQQRLAAVQGEYQLANTGLGGELDLARTSLQGQFDERKASIMGMYGLEEVARQMEVQREMNAINREQTYVTSATQAVSSYLSSLAGMDGSMDNHNWQVAADRLYDGLVMQMDLLNSLYPEFDPIEMPGRPNRSGRGVVGGTSPGGGNQGGDQGVGSH